MQRCQQRSSKIRVTLVLLTLGVIASRLIWITLFNQLCHLVQVVIQGLFNNPQFLEAKRFLIHQPICPLLSKFVILVVLQENSRDIFLKDRLGYKANNSLRLLFLLVKAVNIVVIIRVIHRVGMVIIREVMVEDKIMVIQERME